MKGFTTLARTLRNMFEASGRMHTRAILLGMSDRELADKGFSREKLEAGIHTWPWRIDKSDRDATVFQPSSARHRRAIEELNTYSDRELADLGISRHEIPDVVRHGRPGSDAALDTLPHRLAA